MSKTSGLEGLMDKNELKSTRLEDMDARFIALTRLHALLTLAGITIMVFSTENVVSSSTVLSGMMLTFLVASGGLVIRKTLVRGKVAFVCNVSIPSLAASFLVVTVFTHADIFDHVCSSYQSADLLFFVCSSVLLAPASRRAFLVMTPPIFVMKAWFAYLYAEQPGVCMILSACMLCMAMIALALAEMKARKYSSSLQKAQEQAAFAKQRFANTFSSVQTLFDASCICNKKGVILSGSKGFEHLFGSSFPAKKVNLLSHVSDFKRVLGFFERASKNTQEPAATPLPVTLTTKHAFRIEATLFCTAIGSDNQLFIGIQHSAGSKANMNIPDQDIKTKDLELQPLELTTNSDSLEKHRLLTLSTVMCALCRTFMGERDSFAAAADAERQAAHDTLRAACMEQFMRYFFDASCICTHGVLTELTPQFRLYFGDLVDTPVFMLGTHVEDRLALKQAFETAKEPRNENLLFEPVHLRMTGMCGHPSVRVQLLGTVDPHQGQQVVRLWFQLLNVSEPELPPSAEVSPKLQGTCAHVEQQQLDSCSEFTTIRPSDSISSIARRY